MARPPDTEKRRELARRAVAVMQREGVDVPMSRLAEALELKRPTLLYHFPTRGHIVAMALEDLLTEQAMFVLERVSRHEHPLDRLYEEVAYLAYHFHWEPDDLLDLEHADRRMWVEQVASINRRINEASQGQ